MKRKPKRRTPKQKRGRPPISDGLVPGRKTPIRNLRVPDHEWKSWQVAGKRAGLTLSAWIRRELDRAAARQLAPKDDDLSQRQLEF